MKGIIEHLGARLNLVAYKPPTLNTIAAFAPFTTCSTVLNTSIMSENTPQDAVSKQRWLPLTSPPSSPIAMPVRSALVDLPVVPLEQKPQLKANQLLTPPTTPLKPQISGASASADKAGAMLPIDVNLSVKPSDRLNFKANHTLPQECLEPDAAPKPYTAKYQLDKELGYGAWSTVYRAVQETELLKSSTNLPPTPPTSPITSANPSSMKVLAVKKPSGRPAQDILLKEAKILTYIHSHANTSNFVVPFHGFDPAHQSIILDAVPLSLEAYVKADAGRPLSTKTMFDPVIGAEEWTCLAEGLISGLAFLHSIGCVHGDIKPPNVLLRSESGGQLTPLYCDFSSSHIISSAGEEKEVEEVSAVTTEYLSPELLEALSPRSSERAVATYASDVFALGVTLLFVAIGDSPYAGARLASQKLGMAKEGLPLEFARWGEQASRVMKGRAVEKGLKGALAKEAKKRVAVAEWRDEIREIVKSWQEGGWTRGG